MEICRGGERAEHVVIRRAKAERNDDNNDGCSLRVVPSGLPVTTRAEDVRTLPLQGRRRT